MVKYYVFASDLTRLTEPYWFFWPLVKWSFERLVRLHVFAAGEAWLLYLVSYLP